MTSALPALIPIGVLILGLDLYCLVNLARAKSARNLPKLAWVLIILLVSAPLGALLYLFFGADRTSGKTRARAVRTAPSPEVPPGLVPIRAGTTFAQPVTGTAGQLTAGQARQGAGRPRTAGSAMAVTTSGLTRDYGGTGVFDVAIAVPRGSVYGLVGPNGSGKTTLLSILAGTRRADRGTVAADVGRLRVAVWPDVAEFDGWLTARETVELARSLIASQAGARTQVAAALGIAGLADVAERRVGGFSRGMTQRLSLACALVGDPELLILDEPAATLDPAGRAEILDLVAEMRGSRTVIFSSHVLGDVQRVADQVGILRDGRLLYQGSTSELIETYLSPSWLVRIAGDAEPVAAAIESAGWATKVELSSPDTIRVDAVSFEAGERGIPSVIAGCGARQISCEPAAADLESAFLALTAR